jgi:hypothetical protein
VIGFELFLDVTMTRMFLWVLILCSSKKSRCFEGIYRHHIQDGRLTEARNEFSLLYTSAGFLLGLIFDPEDEEDMFLRNVAFPPNGMALQSRRSDSSTYRIVFTYLLNPFLLYLTVSGFFFLDNFTDGRTSWTSDQPVAMPLPKHRTTQTQNKHIHISNINALCGIQTHDPGFRASEDNA